MKKRFLSVLVVLKLCLVLVCGTQKCIVHLSRTTQISQLLSLALFQGPSHVTYSPSHGAYSPSHGTYSPLTALIS